jgi:galactonate dehydratase
MHIYAFSFHVLHVNPKTNWSFVRVELNDGIIGWGECSMNSWERAQAGFAAEFGESLKGRSFQSASDIESICECFPDSPGGLIAHSVKSATEQALLDGLARYRGKTIYALLAAERDLPIERSAVAVYAHINGATQPRTSTGFEQSAKKAVASGFRGVKLAPFDSVLPSNCERPETLRLIDQGIARVFAVREAVGREVSVKVDCQWRFTAKVAAVVLDKLRAAQLDWFEYPISEQPEHHGAIRALRARANANNVRLAGAGTQTNVQGFRTFIENGLYDAITPDVKYCGGIQSLLDIAALAAKYGVQTAPHNATGPVGNFASLQVCAIAASCDLLEYPFDESQLLRDVVFNVHPTLRDGQFLIPNDIGVGAQCDMLAFEQNPFQPVVDDLHPSLG